MDEPSIKHLLPPAAQCAFDSVTNELRQQFPVFILIAAVSETFGSEEQLGHIYSLVTSGDAAPMCKLMDVAGTQVMRRLWEKGGREALVAIYGLGAMALADMFEAQEAARAQSGGAN